MLTIKHIDQNGDENISQCHRFVRERRHDGFTQFLSYGEHPLPGEYIFSWCGDEEQRTDSLVNRQTIYVMNQHGSTVATYHFWQPDFRFGGGVTPHHQACPEAVAASRVPETV